MDLTTIIACKNRFHNLEYCISSIATSNHIPKVIVVDFGGKEKLDYLSKKYSWLSIIKVIRNTKIFHKTRAINIGIRAADTKFVCLTDVDQLFQPNFFDVVAQELQNNENAFIRCETNFLPSLPKNVYPKNINHDMYFELLKLAIKTAVKKPHGEGCCHGVSRKIITGINSYDENYIGWGFEDKDLALRLNHYGVKTVWVTKKTSMIHLPHSRSNEYFGSSIRNKNEILYKNKLNNIELIANKDKQWGKL